MRPRRSCLLATAHDNFLLMSSSVLEARRGGWACTVAGKPWVQPPDNGEGRGNRFGRCARQRIETSGRHWGQTLDFELFHDAQYGGQGISYSWIDRARDSHRYGAPHEAFDRFTALWTAFNGWGMCVSLAETDAAMIKALGRDPEVTAVFDHVTRDGRFRDRFERAAPSFPLPSFADLIRVNPRFEWRGPRDRAYWAEIGQATAHGAKVRMSPPLDPANPNWADVLGCTYKVRCNLVHGGKIADDNEAEFVGVFADLLEALLTDEGSNLLHLGRRW